MENQLCNRQDISYINYSESYKETCEKVIKKEINDSYEGLDDTNEIKDEHDGYSASEIKVEQPEVKEENTDYIANDEVKQEYDYCEDPLAENDSNFWTENANNFYENRAYYDTESFQNGYDENLTRGEYLSQ